MIRQKKFARRDAYDFYSLTWKELGTDTMHTSQEFLVHEPRLPLPSQFTACLVVLGLPELFLVWPASIGCMVRSSHRPVSSSGAFCPVASSTEYTT